MFTSIVRRKKRKLIIAIFGSLTSIIVFGIYHSLSSSAEKYFYPQTSAETILHYEDDQFSVVRTVQEKRKRLFTEMCEKYFPEQVDEKKEPYPWMWSSDNQRFLYCYIPKFWVWHMQTACTTWKRLLATANGAPQEVFVVSPDVLEYVDQFRSLPESHQRHVLNNYFKFLFVRHPFERLVSAYLNKFSDRKVISAWRGYADRIRSKYRVDKKLGDSPPTFREFVQYLIDPDTERPFNRHWQPHHEICQPCRINFDFIGHYETLADDTRYVLDRLRIRGLQRPQPAVSYNSTSKLAAMLSELSNDEIRRLADVYRLDFALFGYSPNISVYLSDG